MIQNNKVFILGIFYANCFFVLRGFELITSLPFPNWLALNNAILFTLLVIFITIFGLISLRLDKVQQMALLLMGLGGTLNGFVMLINNGYMPIPLLPVRMSGIYKYGDHLAYLGDMYTGFGMSIGDMMVVSGIVLTIIYAACLLIKLHKEEETPRDQTSPSLSNPAQ